MIPTLSEHQPLPLHASLVPNVVVSLPVRPGPARNDGRGRAALLHCTRHVLDHLDALTTDPADWLDHWPLADTVERDAMYPWVHRWWVVPGPRSIDVRTGVPMGREGWGWVARARIPYSREDLPELLRAAFDDPDAGAPVGAGTPAIWAGEHPAPAQRDPVALYWGDGDWTCSTACAARAWFSFDRLEAAAYWDSDDANTYSVHSEDLQPEPGGLTMHDLNLTSWAPASDWLAPGMRCTGCGRTLRRID